MSQEVPPDQHFETISARNIYIQTRRAIHEFNILQRRIARGVSLLQYVVPSPDTTTLWSLSRQSKWFYSCLGHPGGQFRPGYRCR